MCMYDHEDECLIWAGESRKNDCNYDWCCICVCMIMRMTVVVVVVVIVSLFF